MQYTVLQPFARGGVAELLLIQCQDGRRALLRRLLPQNILNFKRQGQFRRGASIRAAVGSHPNLVASLEHGSRFFVPYEIIEYVEGENLKTYCNSRRQIPLENTLEMLRQAAAGLACVHQAGYMHLDVKPENFLLRKGGSVQVLLTDFDLAREASDQGPRHQHGTPAYMAPEQFTRHVASPASDVFAFSVMAYFMLTRKMPFSGQTEHAAWRNQASESVIATPPSEYNSNIPRNLNQAICRGLAKRPGERLPNMSAWLDCAF